MFLAHLWTELSHNLLLTLSLLLLHVGLLTLLNLRLHNDNYLKVFVIKVMKFKERIAVSTAKWAVIWTTNISWQAEGVITSKIKHAIKHKTSPARLAQLLQHTIAGLVLSFIACFILFDTCVHRAMMNSTAQLNYHCCL